MEKQKSLLSILLLAVVITTGFFACGGSPVPKSSEKDITLFQFKSNGSSGALTKDVMGFIEDSTTSGKVTVKVPYGVANRLYTPTIVVSDKAEYYRVTDASGNTPIDDTASQVIDFSHDVFYKVMAEDGSSKVYKIVVENSNNDKALIIKFLFNVENNGQINHVCLGKIDNQNGTIKVIVPKNVDLQTAGLTPYIEVSPGATVDPKSGNTKVFSQSIEYTVTAQDGVTTRTYTVTVENAKDDTCIITGFGFRKNNETYSEFEINQETGNITVTVPFSTNIVNLSPTIAYEGASIDPLENIGQNFTNPVTYTVIAANGTKKEYIVQVVKALPEISDKSNTGKLTFYQFDETTKTAKIRVKDTGTNEVILKCKVTFVENSETGEVEIHLSDFETGSPSETICPVDGTEVTIAGKTYDLGPIVDDLEIMTLTLTNNVGTNQGDINFWKVLGEEKVGIEVNLKNGGTEPIIKYAKGEFTVGNFPTDSTAKVVSGTNFEVDGNGIYTVLVTSGDAKRLATIDVKNLKARPNAVVKDNVKVEFYEEDGSSIYSEDGKKRMARLSWTYDVSGVNEDVDKFNVSVVTTNTESIADFTIDAGAKVIKLLPLTPTEGTTTQSIYDSWKELKANFDNATTEEDKQVAQDELNTMLGTDGIKKSTYSITIVAQDKFTQFTAKDTEAKEVLTVVPPLPTELRRVIPEGYTPDTDTTQATEWKRWVVVDVLASDNENERVAFTEDNIQFMDFEIPENTRVVDRKVTSNTQMEISLESNGATKQGATLKGKNITAKIGGKQVTSMCTQFVVSKEGVLTTFNGKFEDDVTEVTLPAYAHQIGTMFGVPLLSNKIERVGFDNKEKAPNVNKIMIPEGVEKIGQNTFVGLKNMNIELNDKVEIAFNNASNKSHPFGFYAGTLLFTPILADETLKINVPNTEAGNLIVSKLEEIKTATGETFEITRN